MSAPNPPQVITKPQARDRVSNGSDLLPGIDGRSRVARRYRDIVDGLLSQLPRTPTPADESMARRAAALSALAEQQEAAIVRGEAVDALAYATTANALRRLLSDLGVSSPRRRRRTTGAAA